MRFFGASCDIFSALLIELVTFLLVVCLVVQVLRTFNSRVTSTRQDLVVVTRALPKSNRKRPRTAITMTLRSTFVTAALVLLATALLVTTSHAADSEGKCSSSSTLYTCPNCGGIEVTDCLDCDGYLSTDTVHDMCIDRRLFQRHNSDDEDHDDHYHYLWNDIVGAIVWFFCAGVATACGVGGGGIYVPLGILLFQFAPKQASGLSQASIFGASLGGMFLNIRDIHPEHKFRHDPGVPDENHETPNEGDRRSLQTAGTGADDYKGKYYTRPLINYDMALFLSPMEMAGAVLGVLIQKILPNWLYLLIAGLVLSFTSYKTYKKFFAVRAKERVKERSSMLTSAHQSSSIKAAAVKSAGTGHTSSGDDNGSGNNDDEEEAGPETDVPEQPLEANIPADSPKTLELRKQYLEEDMTQYPKEKLLALVVLWIGLFLLTLFKGGKGVESLIGIDCESEWYAVLICMQFCWMFGFAVYYGRQLMLRQAARVAVRYPYLPDDPIWDQKSLRFYGLFTFIAGIIAGLIGIGGGMVLGPLMLVMGIHPRVSSATTATMIVLTSSSVAVIFVTSGLVPWSYAVFYFFVCLAGAYIGKSQIDGYVKRTGRASLLIFILASIIAFATVGCLVILLTRLADKDWCFEGFNKFCNIESDESCPVDRLLEGFLASLPEGSPHYGD